MSKKKNRKKNKRPFVKPAAKLADKTMARTKAVINSQTIEKTASAPNAELTKPAPKKISSTKTALKPMRPKTVGERLENYLLLMRIDKPIGILLLLWPTYWTLWLAAEGVPSAKNLLIFAWGCILMRSAGCVMNDYADRHIDGKVSRTKERMIVSGKVSPKEALILFAILCVLAFALVCFTNKQTIMLSVGGLLLAATYPFAKRYTHLPQVVLGMAFAWSIPMAWTAQKNTAGFQLAIEAKMWLIYLAVVIWAVIYDTFYAMVDRDDDIKIGVKSTAILFGDADRAITAFLQALMIFTLVLLGRKFALGNYYYGGVIITSLLFVYQQYLIKERDREKCFKAFLNNNYVGLAIIAGIAMDYYFK